MPEVPIELASGDTWKAQSWHGARRAWGAGHYPRRACGRAAPPVELVATSRPSLGPRETAVVLAAVLALRSPGVRTSRLAAAIHAVALAPRPDLPA